MQNKNIIILISIAVVAIIFWKFIGLNQKILNTPVYSETTITSPTSTLVTTIKTPIPLINEKVGVINSAWSVFQTYLSAAKKHDLETVKTLSYQVSDTCKDTTKKDKCDELMDSVYAFGSPLKKSDFNDVWYDNKQIILFTKEFAVSTTTARGVFRGFIYFTKDNTGNIKFLTLNPEVGAFEMTKDKTNEQVDAEVQAMVKDTDQDGLADTIETCDKNPDTTCVKTDPTKRDSNGNGWWDGVENFFYIKP